ncbi:MAG TPA: sigma-70 family RNA polymerase sigma factor [Kofleriaceae bacterium]
MSDFFEPLRPHLRGLAYRMLGSLADAEDVVQDAYLRWQTVDATTVEHPRAYLSKLVTRLCIDRATSARARRESYVGSWLPEPIVDDLALAPDTATELARDVSVALLLCLERLSPLERAAFLLADVFDMDYSAISEALGRSEAACRQLALRARAHVHEARPRFSPSEAASEKLMTAFRDAITRGDVMHVASILAEDCVLHTDGGGKKRAALNPIYGRDKILRFFAGILAKRGPQWKPEVEWARINGLPGFILRDTDEVETFAIEHDGETITTIYGVRNPDKLKHLS